MAQMQGIENDSEFDLENFRQVSPGDDELFTVQSARQVPEGRFAFGLGFNFADDPLVVVDENNDRVTSVIGERYAFQLTGAYGLGRFEIAAALPIIAYQVGPQHMEAGVSGFKQSGLGDLRLSGRGRFLGELDRGLSLSGAVELSLPTGFNAEYAGQGSPTVSPALIAQFRSGRLLLAGNLGARFREFKDLGGGLGVGHAFAYGVGASYLPMARTPLAIMAEVGGEVAGNRREEAPVELRGGLRYPIAKNMSLAGGYGYGVNYGYGAPDNRLFVTLGYRPEAPVQQAALTQTTPPPNPDPDGDGILGENDKCPNDPEDFDGFEDEDGCPETDNDKDGLADTVDKCPNNPEDMDNFQDEDGCPDPDNDMDGLLDNVDKCPNEAEIINGVDDDDGCPDEGRKLVVVGEAKIEIREKLYFATDKDYILPRSEPVLAQLAKTLERNPWIRKLRIEGHTDSRGRDAYNLDLSQRRAESVKRALIERNIAPERVEAVGYGERQPIDTNRTVDGRQNNRRVEFVILEQDPVRPPPEKLLGTPNQVREESGGEPAKPAKPAGEPAKTEATTAPKP